MVISSSAFFSGLQPEIQGLIDKDIQQIDTDNSILKYNTNINVNN
jgi:hypothetical protein